MGLAYEIPGFSFTLPANVDLTAESHQYTPMRAIPATGVGINTGAACAPVAATGVAIVGVLQNKPDVGESATIFQNGISKILLKEAVLVGDILTAAPLGFQKAASTNFGTAIALQAGAANDLIAGLLINLGKQ